MKIIDWIKKNRLEALILFLILALGAFLRLYKIDQYMTFLGDEGRDVLVVRRILVDHDLVFVGPGTSIGSMYLGPIYYYMMVPALLLANFSPVGPAIMIALLGIITIFFVWFVSRVWFGKLGALSAALLYSISITVVIFSRSSWNPNIMPFFSLLSIYSIWRVYKSREVLDKAKKWLIVSGISFGFVLQSHYLGLLLLPTIGFFWLLTFKSIYKDKKNLSSFIKFSLFGFLAFLFLMSPLIAFDFKHNFTNFKGIKDFILGTRGNYSPSLENTLSKILPSIKNVFARLIGARNEMIGLVAAFVILLGSAVLLLKDKKKELYLILLWLFFGALGLSFLRQNVYDHYFGFLFPVPFLLLAATVEGFRKNNFFKYFYFIVAFLLMLALARDFYLGNNPVGQLPRTIAISEKIKEEAQGQPFDLASISENNTRDVYQYFLQVWNTGIVDTEANPTKYTVTNQLFVVCELAPKDCDPVHNPSAWITQFGWSKISDSWPVNGFTVYKLVHNPGQKLIKK